jgi:TorA maturation chaperone TorD
MLPEVVARLRLYQFLARCYTYPGPDFHRGLRQPELWQQMKLAGKVLEPAVQQAIEKLQSGIGVEPDEEELPLLEIEIEYTYLFVNSRPHVPAPPYESAYSDKGLLMGRAVSQVLCAYRDAGVVMREVSGLLPDHMTSELEFMAYLAQQEAATLRDAPARAKAWKERQRRFLAEHLLCWGPAFLTRVENHACRPFYAQIGDLTAALLHFEERKLDQSASFLGRKRWPQPY